MTTKAFEEVSARLRAMLEVHVPPLFVSDDGPMGFALDVAPEGERDPSTWFGAVRIGARYVSLYLMPIYVQPSLLDEISPELRRRMQGKSCFNFTKVDEALFRELGALTRACLDATGGDPGRGRPKRSGSGRPASEGRTS